LFSLGFALELPAPSPTTWQEQPTVWNLICITLDSSPWGTAAVEEVTNMQKRRVQRGHFSSTAVFRRSQNRVPKPNNACRNTSQRTQCSDVFGSIFYLDRSPHPFKQATQICPGLQTHPPGGRSKQGGAMAKLPIPSPSEHLMELWASLFIAWKLD